ncbi:MAG: TolC family protein [Thiohalomonadales bacterium]
MDRPTSQQKLSCRLLPIIGVFIVTAASASNEDASFTDSPLVAPNTVVSDAPFTNLKQLSATRLVSAVLHRNSDVPAMQATWQATQARITQAGALDDPMLSYLIAPQTLSQDNMDFGQKFSISQRLPWSGKRGLREKISRFESEASFENITRARLRLTQASQLAFSDWYFVHAALRINKVNQSLLQEFQDIAEIKYAAGRTSKQDVLRAEVEVALLEHRNIVLQTQRREVLSIMNTLLQRRPDLSLPPPGPVSTERTLTTIDQYRRQALLTHPDLRALQARIRANRGRLDLSEANFYPDIILSAAYNSLWNQQEKRLSVGAAINIPLRDKRRAARDEARAHSLQLDANQKTTVAHILDILQRAYARVDENRHVLSLYAERLLPLAEENLAAAQSDYEAGNGSFLDLISAEKNLMQTQLQLEQARADYQRRWANLEHASGGSLTEQVNTQKKPSGGDQQ